MDENFLKYCIPARTLLAGFIYVTPKEYIKYWLLPAFITLLVISYKYITYTPDQISFLGKPVWFNNNRIFHFLTVLTFIISIITNNNYSKIIPIIDLLGGITIVTAYHL